jgi:UDP-N-acetylmuramate dehydrogenase
MIIQEYFSLKKHHTFHFNISSKYFAAPESEDEIIDLLQKDICKENKILILGGGSNLLFKEDFNGLIIKPNITNINITESNQNTVWVEVGAGMEWDKFVEWCVQKNYYGVENLSLIPGNVGACPVQNIGAYGVEVKDVIAQVNGIFVDTQERFSYKNAMCHFSYRNSIFKKELKNKIIITSVVFELKKQAQLKLDYGDVMAKVKELGELNLANVRQAIIHIRESKLPDHEKLGNAGSFFKNPIVANKVVTRIKKEYPEAPVYVIDDAYSKIPAGWMIDQCQWKGKSIGNAAVHDKQALVLVNKTGLASGTEILNLADEIEKSVHEKFGIHIEKEVNVI